MVRPQVLRCLLDYDDGSDGDDDDGDDPPLHPN